MKKTFLTAILAAAALSACTQLSDKDRAMLNETHDMAQQAKDASIQAEQEAQAARADADKAARAAQNASDKADRIFQQGQNK